VLERLIEGPPVGADVDLKIQSANWESSAEISRLLRKELARHKGIVDIQDDFSREKQFMEITVDESKAKELGIDQSHLVMAVQSAFYGLKVATFYGCTLIRPDSVAINNDAVTCVVRSMASASRRYFQPW